MLALAGSRSLVIEYAAAEKLIRAGDGEAALLYICLLKNGGRLSVREAASALRRSESDMRGAFSRLAELGLLKGSREAQVPEKNELPEYTAEDIRREMAADSDFSPLVREVESVLGKMLNPTDLSILLGLYGHLGLPAEVVLLLVNHCVEEYREKYGPGRVPGMRWIEKEGFVWAREELFTLELAEAYLKRRAEKKKNGEAVKRMLGITDRKLSSTESRYIASWLEMGFGEEALEIAFDRTVVKTGKLSWGYMNSIVKSWHSKGLHTPKEIIEKDGDGKPARSGASESAAPDDREVEQMRRYLDSLRGKR